MGHSAPYRAVVALAGTTAASWRSIRAHLITNGITEPFTVLPHLHALLDVVEALLLEQTVKEADREQLMDRLYRPELVVKRSDKAFVPPPGFDAQSMEDAFAAAAAADAL